MNNWAVGWVDWNLALDEGGGPNWSGNFVDSPIIVNNTIDEFYKQPMFYAMGHFSKYIPENSVRVNIEISNDTTITGTAFLLPNGNRAVVILNQ
jgi:glucosylceramidase